MFILIYLPVAAELFVNFIIFCFKKILKILNNFTPKIMYWAHAATLGQFVEQKFMLSSNFSCDQIYKIERYDFGHTLLRYLSLT